MREISRRNHGEDQTVSTAYEPPALLLIGETHAVVLGLDLTGNDCNGMSEPEFEFLEDGVHENTR